jgi:hypothetical protein
MAILETYNLNTFFVFFIHVAHIDYNLIFGWISYTYMIKPLLNILCSLYSLFKKEGFILPLFLN